VPSASRSIICAAGGGKTTRIVTETLACTSSRVAIVTYTRNNEREIEKKFYEHSAAIPPRVEVMTWFVFLLRELARPYRNSLHEQRIEGICWVEGRSARFAKGTDTAAHYFVDGRRIYSDKIAKFILECNQRSGGAVMRRLSQRFDHIFVDEVQDLAGYDLEVLELILKAGIRLSLYGDHRQAILQTNHSNKNSQFTGVNIIEKLKKWHSKKLATLSYEEHTYRCGQDIADLADGLFPNEPATTSVSTTKTGHDGVFVVGSADVAVYVATFAPQVLRYDRRTDCKGLPAMNFGEAKGLTFDRVLIFPHGPATRWLRTGVLEHVQGSLCRIYVGVTRARYSVTFVHDGAIAIRGPQRYVVPGVSATKVERAQP
jgi:DNA helicase II / ATP-dependent DNA helicase PcrA